MNAGWEVVPLVDLAERLLACAPRRPAVVAVNGYSSGGKTTLATRLADVIPGAVVLHTDDIAWYDSVFDWDDLLVDGILQPFRAGVAVAYRPPAWVRRGRVGAIRVPAGTSVLLVEGVGAGRRSLAEHLDVHVWVETYTAVRVDRNSVRVAAGEMDVPSYLSWDAEERAHLLTDCPWERADVIACGDARLPYDPATEAIVAR